MEVPVLTKCQQNAFEKVCRFIDDTEAKVFILKGYAGTGKTTLVNVIINELIERDICFSLLASTGRAAKILLNTTGYETKTVHGEIYTFTTLNQDLEEVTQSRKGNFNVDSSCQLLLNFELTHLEAQPGGKKTFYIVDEASMISDSPDPNNAQAQFGSGKLLTDLFDYDKEGKFIFVGDVCQLPPVTQSVSPALSSEYIQEHFGYRCMESELTEVVRQAKGVDIVRSAQKVRMLYYNPQPWKWAKFPMRGYNDICLCSSQAQLINAYIRKVEESGYNSATMLGFSNRQCDALTSLLRPAFDHHSHQLELGDLLLVTQNNFISGLMNGDLVVVESIRSKESRAGLTFLEVQVKELFTQKVHSQLLIEDIIYGNQTNLLNNQQRELFIDYYYRMKELGYSQKSDVFNKFMMVDPYLNALRAVYGYALTCHKAQGGEWDYVYLDIPRNVPAIEKPYVYQWIYTAMTRARKKLFIVDDFWVM